MTLENEGFRLAPIGETALLLSLAEEISPEINDRIRSIDLHLKAFPLNGILEWVPGYASLMIFYDPTVVALLDVISHMKLCLEDAGHQTTPSPKQVTIPVVYGGTCGQDLDWLADFHSLTPSDIVRLHTAPLYRVGMMGFTPGFAYLMGLDPALAAPRRESPRTLVPAGSVGIAGLQTGIYPLDSPGGWQLIGRTGSVLYDHTRTQPFLLAPGDEVKFIPQAEGVMP